MIVNDFPRFASVSLFLSFSINRLFFLILKNNKEKSFFFMSWYGLSPNADTLHLRTAAHRPAPDMLPIRLSLSSPAPLLDAERYFHRRSATPLSPVEQRTPPHSTPRSYADAGGLTSSSIRTRAGSTTPSSHRSSYASLAVHSDLRPTRLFPTTDEEGADVVVASTPRRSAQSYSDQQHLSPYYAASHTRTHTPPSGSSSRGYSSAPRGMNIDPCSTFIPPQSHEDRGKVTVVLDLDETLIHARDGPINVRPGVDALLSRLKDVCELVVWTAGERDYAEHVIRHIDPYRAIKHCVFRHRKWWTGQPGYTKDLKALGRPMHRTLIIENTPDCVKQQPENAIVVSDFTGQRGDDVLYDLLEVLEAVVMSPTNLHVSDLVESHHLVAQRTIPCDSSGHVRVFTLRRDSHPGVAAQGRNLDLRPRRY
jgi:RNA polymerase II subunit A small phosphatase-like protein